jgi:hypothetical protein
MYAGCDKEIKKYSYNNKKGSVHTSCLDESIGEAI